LTPEFEHTWYLCELVDGFAADEVVEPDWTKVPAHVIEKVRKGIEMKRAAALAPTRVKLWGPQIEWYMKQPQYKVTVIEKDGGLWLT
jgi:hypothetical protein